MANQNNDNDDKKLEDEQNEGNNGGNDSGNDGGNQNQNQGQNNPNNGGNNSGNNDSGNGGKTFSQEDVSRMMAKEKQQGRNAVFNELGINPDDSSTIALVKAFMAAQSAANDDSGNNDAANDAAVKAAEQRARVAEMKADAMKAGVKAQYVDDAVDLVLARYTDDNNDFNSILNELKSKYGIWFEDTDEDDSNNAGKRGTGSTISSKQQGGTKGNESEGLGKRLAGLRKPATKKSSYFGS